MTRWRNLSMLPGALILVLLLVACGATSQAPSTPTRPLPPTPGPGQQLLQQMANSFNTAKTLHGIFNLNINGTTFNGSLKSEVWNEAPAKSRTVVLQSSVTQFVTGSTTVSDGQQIWQYDPARKIVYNGPIPTNTNNAGGSANSGRGNAQGQFLLNLVQSVSTHSDGTLQSSNGTINGHAVYDVHVVPQSAASPTPGSTASVPNSVSGTDYEGEIYIDKTTQLPIRLDLTLETTGKVQIDLSTLELNPPLPTNLFTFTPPPGVKVLPLAQLGTTGSLSLAQAQQQAGYHLLSIPTSHPEYTLDSVTALGSPNNQIYTLNYKRGTTSFTIAQGKPLANLPGVGGTQVSLRGTTASLSTQSGASTLAWTEQGVGVRITGTLSSDQMVAIAGLLA